MSAGKIVAAASAAIFREDGRVLLAQRARPRGVWSLPGGKCEPGETAAAAAMREAREELGVEIAIVAAAGFREVEFRKPDGEIIRYRIEVFAARLVSGTPTPGPEALETGWFGAHEIASLKTTEGLQESVEQAARALASA
jgi:8-oxo-dGTP diphosphatase